MGEFVYLWTFICFEFNHVTLIFGIIASAAVVQDLQLQIPVVFDFKVNS